MGFTVQARWALCASFFFFFFGYSTIGGHYFCFPSRLKWPSSGDEKVVLAGKSRLDGTAAKDGRIGCTMTVSRRAGVSRAIVVRKAVDGWWCG